MFALALVAALPFFLGLRECHACGLAGAPGISNLSRGLKGRVDPVKFLYFPENQNPCISQPAIKKEGV
jgi:hypothetical protein